MMQPNHQLPGHREHLPVLVHDGTTAPRRSSWLPLTDPRNRKMNGPDHQSEPAQYCPTKSSHALMVCKNRILILKTRRSIMHPPQSLTPLDFNLLLLHYIEQLKQQDTWVLFQKNIPIASYLHCSYFNSISSLFFFPQFLCLCSAKSVNYQYYSISFLYSDLKRLGSNLLLYFSSVS